MVDPSSERHRVLVVAGEASGDLHGANLIRAAREHAPGLSFFGVGGKKMAAEGCEVLISADHLAVMGLFEVAGKFPVIRKAFRRLSQILRGNDRPDLLILIDYPGFNLRLAKVAHEAGVPVLYYICPKVWAWGRRRIKLLAERVDRLACIFPFEPELFAGTGLDARYVGNPLLDEYRPGRSRQDYLEAVGFDPRQAVVGLFPGSRRSEIRYIFDTILQTGRRLQADAGIRQFLMPVAPSLDPAELQRRVDACGLPVRLVTGDIYEIAAACDAVLCVSGTVTLQVALAGTPMAVIYRTSPLSYAIGRRLVRIPHFSLVNIVGGREIVREFLQEQAEPVALAAELRRLLEDVATRESMRAELAALREKMGSPGCSRRVAAMAVELLQKK
ncbi:lipid-A-disaccharide synthase [Geothermobacter ehrlichii]|uniref:Lipid-A-disaccharide synthase n=1 Tax=Geothermobacter ehrlichii TaxID=213224 RepID=A0A5D3WN93_9BACT|nr:lipid-A-disaccharide synthase [Geothermobacter ehrlichii]TYP00042.1 lipid-A-disaccharide synthase [Geothermobacter ehrlichii]